MNLEAFWCSFLYLSLYFWIISQNEYFSCYLETGNEYYVFLCKEIYIYMLLMIFCCHFDRNLLCLPSAKILYNCRFFQCIFWKGKSSYVILLFFYKNLSSSRALKKCRKSLLIVAHKNYKYSVAKQPRGQLRVEKCLDVPIFLQKAYHGRTILTYFSVFPLKEKSKLCIPSKIISLTNIFVS